jgi:hypothetical protein
LLDGLKQIDGVTIYGPTDDRDRGSTVSFALDGLHPHDVGQVLDDMGIAVRVGNHCARPIMDKLKVQSTTRASTYIYNDDSDIKALIDGIEEARKINGVEEIICIKGPGDVITQYIDNGNRFIWIITSGNTRDEVLEIFDKAKAKIKFNIQ